MQNRMKTIKTTLSQLGIINEITYLIRIVLNLVGSHLCRAIVPSSVSKSMARTKTVMLQDLIGVECCTNI